jgi:hypothetical protein
LTFKIIATGTPPRRGFSGLLLDSGLDRVGDDHSCSCLVVVCDHLSLFSQYCSSDSGKISNLEYTLNGKLKV